MTPFPFPEDLSHALDAAAVRLGASTFPSRLLYVPDVGSTSDVLADLAVAGAAEGTVVVADAQTAGRGRRGRSWFSPPGAGLYVSVLFRPPSSASAAYLTLLGGVAMAEGILASTGLQVSLKWPNDLVVEARGRSWRKVGGILAEASAVGAALQFVVLGCGVNLRPASYPPAIADRATALEDELGRACDRGALLVESLLAIDRWYRLLRADRIDAILSRWRALAPASQGAIVRWQTPDGPREGRTDGIDPDGALRVKVGDTVERIVSGELEWFP